MKKLGKEWQIDALAGTTACKSVQLVRLKKWAQEHGCWYDDRTRFGDFFDRGSENEVCVDTAHATFANFAAFTLLNDDVRDGKR